MPRFLRDLYGDLRDLRLLIPVVGLLVAIAAVPLLLGGDSPPPPPPAVAPVASVPADAAQVQPAVLAEQTGIRNYRERLAALQRKNPFKQQFQVKPVETAVEVGSGSGAAGDPSISLAGDEPAASQPVAPTPETSSSSTTPAGDPSISIAEGVETAPSSTGGSEVREVETVISYEVDVEVGRAGELEPRDGVEMFAPLPSKAAPVVIYVGVTENAERAAFLVSRDVTDTKGDGICARSKSGECALVTMRVGDDREFLFGPDAERFRLKVSGIEAIEQTAER